MTRMRRILATVAVAALAVTAAALPVTSAGAVPASETGPATTITFQVVGCNGCVLQGVTPNWDNAGYQSGKVTVKSGTATLTVPTAQTKGMVFTIDAPWKVEIDAQPLVVFQYKGATIGETVTRAEAISAKRGSPCWTGTTQSTVSLDMRVHTVRVPAFPDESKKTRVPVAYIVPTQPAMLPFLSAWHGIVGVQDFVPCGPRSDG